MDEEDNSLSFDLEPPDRFSMGSTMSSYSTAEQLKSAAVAPGALFLDVRNNAEVKESPLTSRPYLHVSCMPDDCSELTARADELLPDKNGTVQHM